MRPGWADEAIEQARNGYTGASYTGNKAAAERITFLSVKQLGYQKGKHADWLQGIQQAASENKTEALIILRQMCRNGIALDKDLDKSLELL